MELTHFSWFFHPFLGRPLSALCERCFEHNEWRWKVGTWIQSMRRSRFCAKNIANYHLTVVKWNQSQSISLTGADHRWSEILAQYYRLQRRWGKQAKLSQRTPAFALSILVQMLYQSEHPFHFLRLVVVFLCPGAPTLFFKVILSFSIFKPTESSRFTTTLTDSCTLQIRALNRELRKLLVRGVEASVEANPSSLDSRKIGTSWDFHGFPCFVMFCSFHVIPDATCHVLVGQTFEVRRATTLWSSNEMNASVKNVPAAKRVVSFNKISTLLCRVHTCWKLQDSSPKTKDVEFEGRQAKRDSVPHVTIDRVIAGNHREGSTSIWAKLSRS